MSSESTATPAGTARFTGTPSAGRRTARLPGHCDTCVLVGHEAAHPDMTCADVDCTDAHGLTEAGLPQCADCRMPITGAYLADIPLPGETGTDQLRYTHTGPSACAQAQKEAGLLGE